MILVTGATGAVGGRTAEILSEQGGEIRLLVRDAGRAPKLTGAEVTVGDYGDPASLDKACEGVERVLIVSGHAPEGERAKLHKNVMDAAARAGAKHLVYLSFQNASPNSKFPMGRDHYITESYLADSGVPYTALRDNLYLDFAPAMFDQDGVLRGPGGNGFICWVAREDVAQVAAAVLQNPPTESGGVNVTGPEAMTFAETAERLAGLTGRELSYRDEPLEEAKAWRRELGVEEWEVEMMVGSYLAVANGELGEPSDTVERFTGRKPYSLEEFFGLRPELLGHLQRGERNNG